MIWLVHKDGVITQSLVLLQVPTVNESTAIVTNPYLP